MKLSLLKEKTAYLLAMNFLAPRVLVVSCLEKTGRQITIVDQSEFAI